MAISNLPVLHTIALQPTPRLNLALGTEFRNIYNSTLYGSVVQMLRQRVDEPFDLNDVSIQVKIYQPYCEAIITPKVLTGDHRVLGDELVIRYDRLHLNDIIREKFFFDGRLPMSFGQFGQYIYDRYGFVMESEEFILRYSLDNITHDVVLMDNTIITTMGDVDQFELIVTSHSGRWIDGNIVVITKDIAVSNVQPLILNWSNQSINTYLHIQLEGQGGVAPYTYSTVQPMSQYIVGQGYANYPITYDPLVGLIEDRNALPAEYTVIMRVTDTMGSTSDTVIVATVADLPFTPIEVVSRLSTWDPKEYANHGWLIPTPYPPDLLIPLGANQQIEFDDSIPSPIIYKAVKNDLINNQYVALIFWSIREFGVKHLKVLIKDSDTGQILQTLHYNITPHPRSLSDQMTDLLWTFSRRQTLSGSMLEREGNWITFQNNNFYHLDGVNQRTRLAPNNESGVIDHIGNVRLSGFVRGSDSILSNTISHYSGGHHSHLNGWGLKTGTYGNFVNSESGYVDLTSAIIPEPWSEISTSPPLRNSFHMTLRLRHMSDLCPGTTICSTRDYLANNPNNRIHFYMTNEAQPKVAVTVRWINNQVTLISNVATPTNLSVTWALKCYKTQRFLGTAGYQHTTKFVLYLNGVPVSHQDVVEITSNYNSTNVDFRQSEFDDGYGVFGHYGAESQMWKGDIEFCTFNWWDLDDELITLISSPSISSYDQLWSNAFGEPLPDYSLNNLPPVAGYVGDEVNLLIPVDHSSITRNDGALDSRTTFVNLLSPALNETVRFTPYTDPITHIDYIVMKAVFDSPINVTMQFAGNRTHQYNVDWAGREHLSTTHPNSQFYFGIPLQINAPTTSNPDPLIKYWSTLDSNVGIVLSDQGSGHQNKVAIVESGPKIVRSRHAALTSSYVEFVITTSNGLYVGPAGSREIGIGVLGGLPKLVNGDYLSGAVRTEIAANGEDGVCVYFPSREVVRNGTTIGILPGTSNRLGIVIDPLGNVNLRGDSWLNVPSSTPLTTLTGSHYYCVAAEMINPAASVTMLPPSSFLLPADSPSLTKGIAMLESIPVNLVLDGPVGVSSYTDVGTSGLTWSPQISARTIVTDNDFPLSKAYPLDINGYLRLMSLSLPTHPFQLEFRFKALQPVTDNVTASLVRINGVDKIIDFTISKLLGNSRFGLRLRELNLTVISNDYVSNSAFETLPVSNFNDATMTSIHHVLIMKGNDGFVRLCIDGQHWSSGVNIPDFEIKEIQYGIGSAQLTSVPFPANYGQLRLRTGNARYMSGEIFTPDTILN